MFHLLAAVLPTPLDQYPHTDATTSLFTILTQRIQQVPFNLVATLIFLSAVIHTFFAPYFQSVSEKFPNDTPKNKILHQFFHFLGEVEVIFGLWILPLILAMYAFYDWATVTHYFNTVNYVEPIFIVVIMAIASSQPILQFARQCMQKVAAIGHHTPKAWWFSILTIGPLLGSFITEPAAITISALLLAQQFYVLQPSLRFRYATLGLLFVNISVGGVLTHFAAPPVLMVAHTWDWDTAYMFTHFGLYSIIGILIATSLYGFIFRKEFQILSYSNPVELDNLNTQTEKLGPSETLNTKRSNTVASHSASATSSQSTSKNPLIPGWVVTCHLLFLIWTICNIHTPSLLVLGFLFFLGFVKITGAYQTTISLKSPVLVGFFLAGLVTHGGLQQWWIEALLGKLNETFLFFGSALLTAFNDNAAITYLASLVPEISNNAALQHAIVCGAVTGGGLTVIANAPNPAGQSILSRYFGGKIAPAKLLLGALPATVILGTCFLL